MLKYIRGIILLTLIVGLVGCATKGNQISYEELAQRNDNLSALQNRQKSEIQRLRDKIKVLESTKPQASQGNAVSGRNELPPELNGMVLPAEEKELYKLVLSSYQQNKIDELQIVKSHLVYRFPRSIFADNSIYLTGRLLVHFERYGEALKEFNLIIKDYQQSNKLVSALLAKGMAYAKLNLPKSAKKIFADLVKDFPGSPESAQAQLQLGLLAKL